MLQGEQVTVCMKGGHVLQSSRVTVLQHYSVCVGWTGLLCYRVPGFQCYIVTVCLYGRQGQRCYSVTSVTVLQVLQCYRCYSVTGVTGVTVCMQGGQCAGLGEGQH